MIKENSKFSQQTENFLNDFIVHNNLTEKNIKQVILYLKVYVSKNEERIKFLIAFPFIFALIILFEKLNILETFFLLKAPLNYILIGFYSFLMLFVFSERTNLIEYKHGMEELILFLENWIDNNKVKLSISEIEK